MPAIFKDMRARRPHFHGGSNCLIFIVFCFCLLFLHPDFSIGQEITATPAEESSAKPTVDVSGQVDPLLIKLSVDEVRLDVVVLDNKGNPVTDLTAKDFEIMQNGKRQKIISGVYIDNQSSDVTAKPSVAKSSAALKDNQNIPLLLPTKSLKREDILRTIILVVDDLSMSFQDGHNARMALRNFVEKQMQPGDMVAILRTGYGNSALQFFLSDRRETLARIDALHFDRALSPNIDASHLYRVYDNQLSTITYGIRALKDMPGRKMLAVMTANTTIFNMIENRMMSSGMAGFSIYEDRFSRLADDALRAGVVVNFLNISGLENVIRLKDLIDPPRSPKTMMVQNGTETRTMINPINGAEIITERPAVQTVTIAPWGHVSDYSGEVQRASEMMERFTHPAMKMAVLAQMAPEAFTKALNSLETNYINPLPLKTGGVIIENSNFFLDGIGRETESLMKGYYLISYEPSPDTFGKGDKEVFNKIKVNVNRRGVKVYTRDGFYNRLEGGIDSAPAAHPLQDAVFSPFMHSGLDVNVFAGYVRDAKAGHYVRSWIHVDPKDVQIVDTEDGGARIDLQMVCLTSDTNGYIQDSRLVDHTLTIKRENRAENLALIQKHGIRFAMLLPVKKPGFYYVRAAVLDKGSGRTGSAYQSVEIPDPGRRGLAMSDMFIISNPVDLAWLISGAAEGEAAEGILFPVFQFEEVRSPALREYSKVDGIQILAMVYNADEKAIAASEIERRFVLYKDDVEYMRSDGVVAPGRAGNLDGIPLFMRLTMSEDVPLGDYVLQMQVTNKKNSTTREGNVSRFISFRVTE